MERKERKGEVRKRLSSSTTHRPSLRVNPRLYNLQNGVQGVLPLCLSASLRATGDQYNRICICMYIEAPTTAMACRAVLRIGVLQGLAAG